MHAHDTAPAPRPPPTWPALSSRPASRASHWLSQGLGGWLVHRTRLGGRTGGRRAQSAGTRPASFRLLLPLRALCSPLRGAGVQEGCKDCKKTANLQLGKSQEASKHGPHPHHNFTWSRGRGEGGAPLNLNRLLPRLLPFRTVQPSARSPKILGPRSILILTTSRGVEVEARAGHL